MFFKHYKPSPLLRGQTTELQQYAANYARANIYPHIIFSESSSRTPLSHLYIRQGTRRICTASRYKRTTRNDLKAILLSKFGKSLLGQRPNAHLWKDCEAQTFHRWKQQTYKMKEQHEDPSC